MTREQAMAVWNEAFDLRLKARELASEISEMLYCNGLNIDEYEEMQGEEEAQNLAELEELMKMIEGWG